MLTKNIGKFLFLKTNCKNYASKNKQINYPKFFHIRTSNPQKNGHKGSDNNQEIKQQKTNVKTSLFLPPYLLEKAEKQNKFLDNPDIKAITFNGKIYPLNHPPFTWKTNKNRILTTENLPTRLYKINQKAYVARYAKEITKDKNIKNYATISYVWIDDKPKNDLSSGGKKALKKAIKVCKNLKIDYLWMDQLCVKQGENEEAKKDKKKEIPKMRQYYSNASVTLIAIQTRIFENNNEEIVNREEIKFDWLSILIKIVNSEWFSRSWTFQEGLLSCQTIFMFDDFLIDGRFMAAVWAYSKKGGEFKDFYKGSVKIATPLGWTYYKNGYIPEDKIFLSLNQTVKEINKRRMTLTTDSVYSILGLLPYGKMVKIDYSLSPKEALNNIIKTAVKNGYGENLTELYQETEINQTQIEVVLPKN